MKILLILSLLLNLVIITYKRKHKMKNLTLTLNATDIVHAVKSDTYITGQIDKSSDMVKNAALAYNEQAGDESYHTTKIYRTMKGALAKLEASIAEYVETSNPEALITDTLSPELGSFTITISLGDRTSGAFATPMAYIAQEYIINTTLYSWWQPIRPALAKDYLAFANDNILDIKRCLAKSAPSSGSTSYDDISGDVTPADGNHYIYPTTEALADTVLNAPSDGKAFRIPASLSGTTFTYSGSPSTTFVIAPLTMGIDEEEINGTPTTGTISAVNTEMTSAHDADVLVWIAGGSVSGKTLSY